MLYFDPICPFFNFGWFTFFNWILWWENKVICKKLRIVLDDEFSLGKIICIFICFNLLTLWAFALSFANGGSTFSYIILQLPIDMAFWLNDFWGGTRKKIAGLGSNVLWFMGCSNQRTLDQCPAIFFRATLQIL